MTKIYKYPFPLEREFLLMLPVGAVILKAEMQGKQPCIWAMVNPEAYLASRRFHIFGTGWEIDASGLTYINTFQQGPFVWHLFERL